MVIMIQHHGGGFDVFVGLAQAVQKGYGIRKAVHPIQEQNPTVL